MNQLNHFRTQSMAQTTLTLGTFQLQVTSNHEDFQETLTQLP